ncbi:phage tail tape measure protein [Streptacidiphilus sp. EB129]|uniref:phage tail tape measure protein n=1 Tax=Streptacidiphilus sp. EB129 TaxID=3156262 RepID=UPI0035169A4D
MSDVIPPIMVELGGTAAEFLKTINSAVSSLKRLTAAATAAAEACDTAFASLASAAEAAAASTDVGFASITEGATAMSTAVGEASATAAEGLASMDEAARATGVGMSTMGEEIVASMQGAAAEIQAAAVEMRASMAEVSASVKVSAEEAGAASEGMGAKMLGIGEVSSTLKAAVPLSLAAIGYESVKMASTFQASTTRLVTSAGESAAKIDMVRQGLLNMAGQVGVSADDLSQALYYVDAAGYHAGDGLTVLKAAAQGAAAEGADTTTVAKALTDVLVDYHLKASDAANVTSQMIAAVANGKTNLQDFSGAFASIVPAASAAGISVTDVMSALAQMTNHGFTAARASQNLAQALRSMLNPTNAMQGAFATYGVSSATLREKLNGPNGLTDAMEYLSQAATKAGKEGTPAFAAALKSLMGTAPGANAALATVGANYTATGNTILAVGKATADAQGKVSGFALVQQNLSWQLKSLRAGFDSVMIKIGDGLIPMLSGLITLVESKATPVIHGLSTAVSGIMSGFSGSATKQAKPTALPGGKGHAQLDITEPAAAPDLTPWQKVGVVLKQVAGDLKTFGDDAAKAFGNLAKAAGPTLALLGGAGLTALKVIAGILANVVGPALVLVTGLMDKHKGVIRDLIAVALIPLALRLSALAIIKPIMAVAGLAKDIVMFPINQAKQIGTAVKGAMDTARSGVDTARGVWGGLRMAVVTVGQSIGQFASNAAGTLRTWGANVASTASTAWSSVSSTASTAWSGIASGASKLWTGLQSGFSTATSAISQGWTAAGNGLSALGGQISSAAGAAKDLAVKMGEAVAAGAKNAWSGMLSGLQAVTTATKAAALAAWDLTTKTLASAAAALRAAGAWVLDKIQLAATAVAEGLASAAEWVLNVAMDANPIMLVVIALAAIVGALIYAYNHFTWFRDIVNACFKAVGDAVSWIVDFVKAHWPLLLAIITGPIGMAVLLISRYWSQISGFFSAGWNFVVSAGEKAATWLAALPGRIWGWFSGAGKWLYNAGVSIIEGLWNGILSMGSWIAGQITQLIKDVIPGPVLSILGIHSPSTVFHEIGVNTMLGLAGGITATGPQAANASRQMAMGVIAAGSRALTGGVLAASPGGSLAVAAGGASGGSNLPTIVVNVDGKKLFEVVQTQALRYGRRNPTTGVVYGTS